MTKKRIIECFQNQQLTQKTLLDSSLSLYLENAT
jgi:hypothetical protein